MTDLSQVRTTNYLKQLRGSVLYKAGAILATFLAMPLMVRYLGVEVFGIWATMLTLVSWVMLFDLGIGNGLKNKVAESLARNDRAAAASYVSTAYVAIGSVSLVLLLALVVISGWLPWQVIFNTLAVSDAVLQEAVITLACFVFINFWISLVNQVFHGLQSSAYVVLGQFVSNALALLLVFALYLFAASSLTHMVWAFGLALIAANVTLSLILFRQHRELFPSVLAFDRGKVGSLLSLGVKFFVVQFAVIVIFMTDKILISQLLGPAEVTPYEVLFKLFSLFTVAQGLILAPLWPAYSDAYARSDLEWIRKQLKKQIILAFALLLSAVAAACLGPLIVHLWMGDAVNVSRPLYFMFALFIGLSVWNNVFAYFVNAIGKLSVQLVTALLAACLNIPLSIFFVRDCGMGAEGVLLATVASLSIYGLVGPLEVYKLTRKTASC
ncbi:hypothetical protein AO729_07900 [Pseudomonas sp. TTU2014-066ASC]|nr:hypothetical protein AO729_07900 [Pseudomonas sp. TTU2014-066ASC]